MITPQNLDKWMFDYLEGNLSGEDAAAFEQFLQNNPEVSADLVAWQEAYVAPVTAEFPNMAGLEKKRKVAAGWYGWAAAATIALLLGWGGIALFSSDDFQIDGMANEANDLTPAYSVQTNIEISTPKLPEYLNTIENELSTSQNSSFVYSTNVSSGNSSSNAPITNANNTNNSTNNYSNQTNMAITGNTTNIVNNSDVDFENSNAEFNTPSVNSSELVLAQAKSKIGDNEGGQYANNPEVTPVDYELKHSKSVTIGGFSTKLKRFYRKIERTMGYPVGLKNLRDPEMFIPQNASMAVNPGLAGGMLASRFEMNYRNQFFGSDLNSQEMNLAFDTYSRSLRGGLGVLLNVHDVGMGEFTDMNINLIYSPKFRLNENVVFEPGVRLTLGTLTANTDQLSSFQTLEMDRGRFLNTGDLTDKSGFQRTWYKDYSLGGMFNTTWFYAGFSADNLGGHFENIYASESGLPQRSAVRYNLILGSDYESKDERFGISPFLSFTSQDNFNELWGGFNSRIGWLTIGGAISNNLDYTGSIGLKFEKFKLIYRYDNARSMFTNEQLNSHNIGIRFNTKQKSSRIK